MTKICTTCKQEKELDQFHRNNQNKDGYLNICKDCKKASYEANKEKYLERQRKRRASPEQKLKDKLYAQKYRQEHFEVISAKAKDYEARPDIKARRKQQKFDYLRKPDIQKRELLKLARDRAKIQNIPFEITEDDIVIPEFCPILGIKLEKGKNGHPEPSSPSLDKIKPKLGYVKGNIKIISFRANTIKRDATTDEIRAILKYMEENEQN
jgi:hypothetical protein